MKKQIILATALVVVLISCNDTVQPKPATAYPERVTITVSTDTVITISDNLFAPRYGCNGKKLTQPKLVGVGHRSQFIHLTRTLNMNVDSLLSTSRETVRPVPIPTTPLYNDNSSGTPDWFKALCWILLASALIGLVAWLLKDLFKKSSPLATSAYSGGVSSSEAKDKKTPEKVVAPVQEKSSPENVSQVEFTGIVSIITALKQGPAGGTAQYGNMTITIPSSVPPINVHAERGSSITNVDIIVTNTSVAADMLDIHEQDDNRQYSRTQGDKKS